MFRQVRLHPRLFIAAGIGVVLWALMPAGWGELVRIIFAWDVAMTLHLVLSTIMMARATPDSIRQHAALQDESAPVILLLSAAAASASLCASIGLLSGYKDMPPGQQPVMLTLALYTIISSWFFLHSLFTLHYAHEYYGPDDRDANPDDRGGLQFPGDVDTPGFGDFAYYALTIGMCAQTSDTAVVTSAMRRLTILHAVITFFFNTAILALSINIAASLL